MNTNAQAQALAQAQEVTAPATAPVGYKEMTKIPVRTILSAPEDGSDSHINTLRVMLAKILQTPGAVETRFDIAGLDRDSGEVDFSVYAGKDIYICRVMNKGADIRTILVQPVPRLADVLEAPNASQWIAHTLTRALAQQLVRPIRKPSNAEIDPGITADALAAIPLSIDDYVLSRAGAGSKWTVWKSHAKALIDTLAGAFAEFRAIRVTQDLLRQVLASKAFAERVFPAMEERGVFVKVIGALVKHAAKDGVEDSLPREWLATRDSVGADIELEAEGEEAVDLDLLFGDDDDEDEDDNA